VLVRKTVTVLFCDVASFSGLGERLDPESLRRVMSRYFDEMAAVIERHGGTIEKFIGDEIMAVFGVPRVHEDDALRAVRAGAEMRDRLRDLNEELDARWGVRLEARMGINTGEVVAGDPSAGSTFVTGDAVNLAKRLEQAADPGQILFGKATYPLVKDAVRAGPLESFTVKGKRDPVSPLRLDEVQHGAPGLARRLDAPLVGRAVELATLEDAFARVVAEPGLELVTILGSAGIGKTRLAAELVASVGTRARTLTGRCLPYGEGITFWPLVQLLREAGGEEGVKTALAGTDDAAVVADRLRAVLGNASTAGSEETFWAIRRFLEALARERPLLVVFEDIHWAEPTFLDLLEYLVGWTRRASILVVCLARRELLDKQPGWVGPRPNSSLIALDPLSSKEAEALLTGLRDETTISDEAVEQITIAAEGNPLFIEQLVAMAAENGAEGDLRIPPSIQALLAERLDRLSTPERAVVERAAVIGREFTRAQIVSLCPDELQPAVGPSLMALIRKELVRPDTSAATSDDGFGFRHVLIRDAAYEGMPKEVRAELHQRFSALLEETPGLSRAEIEEIIGYHLERAHACRSQLGLDDEETDRLARSGGERLAAAGRRALARGDVPAAVNLLERAAALLDAAGSPDAGVLLDLGVGLREQGDLLEADSVLTGAAAAVEADGDERLGLLVLIERSALRMYRDPGIDLREVLEVAEQATPVFEAAGDDLGVARAWGLVAEAQWGRARFGAMEDVLERALGYAERAGDRRQLTWILGSLARTATVGPRPVDEAVQRCLEIRERAKDEPTVQPVVDSMLAVLAAMAGQHETARQHYARSREALGELGMRLHLASMQIYTGLAELIAGDAPAAERELRRGFTALERMGEHGYFATMAALLAKAVWIQDRHQEAERLTRASREAAIDDDLVSHVLWRGTQAKTLALAGKAGEAERLARESVRLSLQTDFVNMQADALVDLAETLVLLGRGDDACEALDQAVALYDAKGNTASGATTRATLATLLPTRTA
jgi:class 3 adenylate cyclase/tetratricopeptide (TPR) repeat protein